MAKMTLGDLRTLVAAYVAEAKQAGSWTSNKDAITGLVEKCVAEINLDTYGFEDKLGELGGEIVQGFIEEYFAGLVPAGNRGTDGTDELSPARPTFDEPAYSYPLLNSDGNVGIRFKTTVDDNFFERYIKSGNDAELVNYIIKKLYDSFYAYRFDAKRQLIGNFINKAIDANAGETYTTNSTIIKCGHIYVQSSKYYISKKNFTAAVNKTLATLKTDGDVVEITPELVKVIAKPVDTSTAEAFIKQVKEDVERLTIGPSEGTSLSGSTIGAVNTDLVLYVKPGIQSVLDVDALAGAFHVDKLAIPAQVKALPDFGTIDDDDVYAVLLDIRGAKLFDNYVKANATPVNGSLYTNYFLHYNATAFISKHTAVRVYVAN